MNPTSFDLAGLGFWLALGAVVSVYIWAGIRKQQMKHELTLKLLEKGQGLDHELLAKLLANDKAPLKSSAEKRREESGVGGFTFLVTGLVFAFIGILGKGSRLVPSDVVTPTGIPMMVYEDAGPSWALIVLGVFVFLFGNWIIYSGSREYARAKAEENAESQTSRD